MLVILIIEYEKKFLMHFAYSGFATSSGFLNDLSTGWVLF